jgi:hypothetical protein
MYNNSFTQQRAAAVPDNFTQDYLRRKGDMTSSQNNTRKNSSGLLIVILFGREWGNDELHKSCYFVAGVVTSFFFTWGEGVGSDE